MKTNIINNIKAIILALALTIGVGYVAAGTFSVPSCAPPGCNTDAPLNVGANKQGKLGGLVLSSTQANIDQGLSLIPNLAMLVVYGNINSNGAQFNGPVIIRDGSEGDGRILVSNSQGLVSWKDPSTITSSSVNIFASGLNYTPNNSGSAIPVAVLTPGTYKVSGNFLTYNTGGGGWSGFVLSDSSNKSFIEVSNDLSNAHGTPVTTASPDSTYKTYTIADATAASGDIFVVKRSGYSDGGNGNGFWTEWTVPTQTLTVNTKKYVQLVTSQNNTSGYLYFSK